MSVPPVAVITRTRNRPRYLRRALESVAAQRVEPLLHVVVNDGGPAADVDAVVRAATHRVDLVHLATSVGRGAAANVGLRHSQSTLVVWHDDDDTWHPRFLTTALEAWRRSGRRAVVTAAERVVEQDDGMRLVEVRREPFFPGLKAVSLADVARESCFVNLAFLAERGAVESVGAYDEGLPVYEDWDFHLRFLSSFDVAFVPEVLARYHHREGASGEARNSFEQEAARTADARAVLTNRWLRRPGPVGLLMALGPTLEGLSAGQQRVDKLFNLFHGARQKWPLSALEKWVKEVP
jgi:GT2 family glycosyltransferase